MVGEGAEVHAEVDIGEIIIQGLVVGNIRARRAVEIHAPGKVRGDITTPSLQIDKGVIFEGKCFMEGVADGTRPRPSPTMTSAAPVPLPKDAPIVQPKK